MTDCEAYPGIAHDLEAAKRRIRYLEAVLDAVGASEQAGEWYWPFYQHDGPTVMMHTERWISARKRAAEVLSRCIDRVCDGTSSDVLPDIDGQNLKD